MKRFLENGARPVSALGGLNTQPFGRLGALVFQPHNSDTLYWASLRAQTRIAGRALGSWPTDTRWENVSPQKRFSHWRGRSGPTDRTTPARRLGNNGGCADRMGISFSLWAVFAEPAEKRTPGSRRSACRGWMHPQPTGGLSAQVALLQSPILSAARTEYHLNRNQTRQMEKSVI
jgi:hypothetical protein